MQKDRVFWVCMVLNMLFLFLLVALKPEVHTLSRLAMYMIIKLELIAQIVIGFYGLWKSVDGVLFSHFTKIYGLLLIIYIILKIPALDYLNQYYIVVPGMFSPFPFVLAWVLNKAFYSNNTNRPVSKEM